MVRLLLSHVKPEKIHSAELSPTRWSRAEFSAGGSEEFSTAMTLIGPLASQTRQTRQCSLVVSAALGSGKSYKKGSPLDP